MKSVRYLLFFIKYKNLNAAVDEKDDNDKVDDNSYDFIIANDKYHFLLPGMRWFCFMT